MKTISSIMSQICFPANHSQDLVFKIPKIIQKFDQKYISGHVLPCTQNCHHNSDSTHCAGVPRYPHILADQLTRYLNRCDILCRTHCYWPPRIIRPSYGPDVCSMNRSSLGGKKSFQPFHSWIETADTNFYREKFYTIVSRKRIYIL